MLRVAVLHIRSTDLHLGLHGRFVQFKCSFAVGITGAVLHITSLVLHLGLQVPFCTCVSGCRFAHYMNLAAVLHTVAVLVAVLQVWGYRCRLALGITGAVLHMCLGFPFCILLLEVPFCTWDYRCRFAHVFRVTVFLWNTLPFCKLQVPFCTWDYKCRFAHVCLGLPFCTSQFPFALWITGACLHMCLGFSFCTWDYMAVLHM